MKTNSTSACFASGAQTFTRWLAQFLSHDSCRLAALAALVLIPYSANAAVTEAWAHRFSNVLTNANDQAVKLVNDAKGDIIVTGISQSTRSDVVTIKYSGMDGSILWQQRYAAAGVNEGIVPIGLAVDRAGNVVMTAGSSEVGYPGHYTAKYAAADGALLWAQHFKGPLGDAAAEAMAVDGVGDVVVTGTSAGDYHTAKYAAADGALLWEQRHNNPTKNGDAGKAVAVDRHGNVVVTGTTWNVEVKGPDGYTAKYAAVDGALLWENRDHSPTNGSSSGDAVAVDDSGNVLVTGTTESADGQNYYTAKYAAVDGVLLWKRGHTHRSTTLDQSGNLLVAGYGGERGFYTAKYGASDGVLLWEKNYDMLIQGGFPPPAVEVDKNGNAVVSAFFQYDGTNAADTGTGYYAAKFAAGDGALLWARLYNTSGWPRMRQSVTVDDNGNVAVTGTSDGDYYTVKFAAGDGSRLWEQRYNGPAKWDARVSGVAVDRIGNVAVTGNASNGSDTDYYTAKYAAANGALIWERRDKGPGNGDDIPAALALDRAGNVVVTGYSFNGTNIDFYTAKYAAADGALFWAKRGPRGDARALVLDGADNVVVIGSSFDSYGQFYTAKYAAVDGALLWEKRYGSLSSQAYATAVAVDGSNNVVVTGGTSETSRANNDFYTVKYAAADGSILWETRYDGPANLNDAPRAIGLDGHGNVVVAGFSTTSRSATTEYYDCYTAKYAAADGSRLWEKRYPGPAGQSIAVALAVDGGGNVVVTGSSIASRLNSDYYTAKYAAADGTLLWDKRFNGLANGTDQSTAVTVDGNGNVLVTGSSGNGFDSFGYQKSDYYTAKYAAVDGALLWEQRYDGVGNHSWVGSQRLALGPNGMVIVTGSSFGDYTTVVYLEALPSLSVKLLSTEVRLTFTGKPSQSYFIQRAPAVTGPWGYLGAVTATLEGLIEFIDLARPLSAGFYRTTTP